MRIVVTGANGLVGSRVCEQLTGGGYEVVAFGRGARRVGGPGRWVSVDLTSRSDLERALAAARPDAIIHPAAMTHVDGCERDPEGAWATNVEGSANVARAAHALDAHLVSVSTDYVFDGDHGPYDEQDAPNPRGVYARTKLAAEHAVQVLAPGAAIARTAVVYGWPPAAQLNFGAWLVTSLSEGREVKLFEDQWVSASLADNVAAMLIELAERKLGGIWHVAGADVLDRYTFGRRLCEVFGFDPKLVLPSTLAAANLAGPRPSKSGLSVVKAQRELKTQPLGIEAQLARFHEAWRQSRAA
ncbi:MAG TPA: dTDP-4-dehydrorhamnose reductase [Myxococcaceae bacterium]|nr:dTDP-4-dehydrorhamnose reductase [Myxococcaceae bacterium]